MYRLAEAVLWASGCSFLSINSAATMPHAAWHVFDRCPVRIRHVVPTSSRRLSTTTFARFLPQIAVVVARPTAKSSIRERNVSQDRGGVRLMIPDDQIDGRRLAF
jgi:hypothetical protein